LRKPTTNKNANGICFAARKNSEKGKLLAKGTRIQK
jgi:hypothetical protein